MCYLSGELLHQNKFSVKFIGPNLFFPWLLVFYYLSDSCPCPLHITCITSTSPIQKNSFVNVFQSSVLKNFASFTGKHLGWSLFLIKFFYRTPLVAASVYVAFHECVFFYFSLAALPLLPYSAVTFFV